MSRLLLALALAALGAFFLAASYTARPATSATGDCTLLLGYSNTNQWWGSFETQAGIVNGEWESIAEGGSHVVRLAYENDWNWDLWAANSISSRCSLNDRAPTTVLFDVGFRQQADLDNGVQILTDAVARARSVLAFTGPMILKPMVGASDACNNWSTVAAPQTRDVIAAVVASDPTLSAGPYLTIPCSLFRAGDSLGHFSDSGKVEVARQVAAWWTDAPPVATSTPVNTPTTGPSATPTATRTATPLPTSTPAKSVTGCTVRTTYSNGSTFTRSVAVSVCQGLE